MLQDLTENAIAAITMPSTTLASIDADTLGQIILQGDGTAFSRLLKTAWFAHMLPDASKLYKTWKDLALKKFAAVRTIFKYIPPDENDVDAAKLIYVEQHRAQRIYQAGVQLHYPDLNEYLIVCDVFCGTDHIASFDSTLPNTDLFMVDYEFVNKVWHMPDKVTDMIEELKHPHEDDSPYEDDNPYEDDSPYEDNSPREIEPEYSELANALNCNISVTRRSDWRTVILAAATEVDGNSISFSYVNNRRCDVHISFMFGDTTVFGNLFKGYKIDPRFHLDLEDYTKSSFSYCIETVTETGYRKMDKETFKKFLFLEMALPYA